ncbi:MAG TPA: RsmB/NOP family class I SAM-dependent RNA methyltransferase [Nanoarchaeota archaeon]|nr:RsmB/NOP family class I SAM-dependent RNA methyltransferase [Nanoarchaeota archaeon]
MEPNTFTQRYLELGGKAPLFELPESIRVNTAKITAEELIERLWQKGVHLEKIPFVKNGFYVRQSRMSVSALQEHLQGFYYIHEAASQIPAEVLNPGKTDLVLDCCAAPGGKTTQMALNAKAVVALESQHNRVPALINNIERLGIKNIIVCNTDARMFEPEIKFDKILVDAPCSGNYITDTRWFRKQKLENFKQRSALQKEILANIVNCLSDEGELVYSTCSLEPEEDEMVIDWAIKSLGMKAVEISCLGDKGIISPFGEELDKGVENCRRLWPFKAKTQGFFIAKLVRA